MTATTPAIDRREKAELLETIAQRIKQRERLETELGVDLGLPDLADLRLGLEILPQELARQDALRLEKADPLVDLPRPLLLN